MWWYRHKQIQQTTAKKYKTRHDWVGRGSTENCARDWNLTIIANDTCRNQNPFRKKRRINFLGFWDTNKSPNSNQKTSPSHCQKKKSVAKEKLPQNWLCRPSAPQSKNKRLKKEKKDKYLDLARELRKQGNVRVTVILIVNCATGMVPEGLLRRLEELEIGGRTTSTKFERPDYWEKFRRPVETCCRADPNERSSADAGVKTCQE